MVKDLLAPGPGRGGPGAPCGRLAARSHQRVNVVGSLQKSRNDQRGKDPDPGRVGFEPWKLVVEDVLVVTPPWPDPGPHSQVLDLPSVALVYLVEPQQVPDVAHLRALPLIGLEPAYLAAAPVQHVADVVGRVAGLDAHLRQLASKQQFRDGRTVGVIAHRRPPRGSRPPRDSL